MQNSHWYFMMLVIGIAVLGALFFAFQYRYSPQQEQAVQSPGNTASTNTDVSTVGTSSGPINPRALPE